MIAFTNATVAILRGQAQGKITTAAAAVVGLTSVPVYLRDPSTELKAQGITPEFDLTMSFDSPYDIRDGDHVQVLAWLQEVFAQPPVYEVQHVAAHVGPFFAYKSTTLRVMVRG